MILSPELNSPITVNLNNLRCSIEYYCKPQPSKHQLCYHVRFRYAKYIISVMATSKMAAMWCFWRNQTTQCTKIAELTMLN